MDPATREPDAEQEPLLWPDSRHLPRRRTISRALRLVGLVALLVPIAFAAWEHRTVDEQALGPVTLVVGGAIPTNADVVSIAMLLGLVAVIAAPLVGAWPRGRWRVPMRVASSLAVSTTVLLGLGGCVGVALIAPDYATIGSPSSAGCRVIGADTKLIHSNAIEIGIMQPGSARVDWLEGSWRLDGRAADILSRVDVDWQGDVGTLVVDEPGVRLDALEGLTLRCDPDGR